jgi:hypothetical protein
MARPGPAGGDEDRRQGVLAFIREAAPFAYCDACLALRLDTGLGEMAAMLGELGAGADAPLARVRRACYGCGRTLDLSAPKDGPPP